MNLAKLIPPVLKPNTEISITVSKNNNITTKFYSNGSIIYYTTQDSLCNDEDFEILQLNVLQSNASITAIVNFSIPNTKRDVLFVGDSQGKLTIVELFLDSEEKFKILKEIQVFNAIISDIAVDNTGSKVFVTGAVNMNSNSSSSSKNTDTLLRFLNWDLGNSVGDPMGLNGAAVSLSFASGIKDITGSRVAVADTQGTIIFFTGSDIGAGFKFIKTFKDNNTQYRGVIKDISYSPSSDSDNEMMLGTFGAYQRAKQGAQIRGKYLVSCYSDKRLKLFDGDSGDFIIDIIDDQEIESLSEIKGGWSLLEWVSSDTFVVSGKCGTRAYQVKDGNSSDLLFKSESLQLYGLAVEKENLVGVKHDGSLVGLKLSPDYKTITEKKQINGINKAVNCFSKDLVSTNDGQIYNFKEQIVYANDDNVEIVLLDKIDDNKYISLNRKGVFTEFSTENGVKTNTKRIQLQTEVLLAELDSNKKNITFVNFEFETSIIVLATDEISNVSINKNKDEITAIQNINNKIFIATFDQKHQEAKILTQEEVVLTHKTKISQFIVDNGFITFSDFTGKTQAQSLQDDLNIQDKKFNKSEIIVSVNKWSHHSGKITSMSWNPSSVSNFASSENEPLLATVGLDNSIVIYSLKKTIRPKFKLEQCHKIGITGLLWVSENEIITFGLDGCIKYWSF